MTLLLLPVLILAINLCLIALTQRRRKRAGADEEFALAASLGRSALLPAAETSERRSESRYALEQSCTASILGSEDTRAECRIINMSRSGMRIVVPAYFPAQGQINVEWADKFFVGAISNSQREGDRQILGLRVVASNYR
jgi:hypothetical protein